MDFKQLDAYELLRCQNGNKDLLTYPNGKVKFSRTGSHSEFYYEDGSIAAKLDAYGRSQFLDQTYALSAWHRSGKIQFRGTGVRGKLPSWYWLYRENGIRKEFFSENKMKRSWKEQGGTESCKVMIDKKWEDLAKICLQTNPNIGHKSMEKIIDGVIFELRKKRILSPYDSEYLFENRKRHMKSVAEAYRDGKKR